MSAAGADGAGNTPHDAAGSALRGDAATIVAERDLLDCALCLRLLAGPVTLLCGHTFCKGCIGRALRTSRFCPLCRSPCHLNVRAMQPSVVITRLLELHHGAEVSRRAVEAEEERADLASQQLGLFLLPGFECPFPGMPVTLLVFEPRYLLLMQRCVENATPFGIQADATSTQGVSIRIDSARPFTNGRMVVTGVAEQRYRVIGRPEQEEGSYGLFTCTATGIADAPIQGAGGDAATAAEPLLAVGDPLFAALSIPARALLLRQRSDLQRCFLLQQALASVLMRVFAELPPSMMQRLQSRHGILQPAVQTAASVERTSFYAADALDLPPAARQACFDATSPMVRLLICYGYLCEQAAALGEGGRAGAAARAAAGAAAGAGDATAAPPDAGAAAAPVTELDVFPSLHASAILAVLREPAPTLHSMLRDPVAALRRWSRHPLVSSLSIFIFVAVLVWTLARERMAHHIVLPDA